MILKGVEGGGGGMQATYIKTKLKNIKNNGEIGWS